MDPRKRPRRQNTATGPSSPTPLRPSQATTTSQVSSLSAAPVPPTPTTPSQRQSDQGMPPPPLLKLDSSSNPEGSSRSIRQGNKVVQKTRSWYGSLSRKSTASTSLQRETITGSPLKAGSTPDFHRYAMNRNGETASSSGASQASVNAPSKLHSAAADASSVKNGTPSNEAHTDQQEARDVANKKTDSDDTAAGRAGIDAAANADVPISDAPQAADIPQRPSTWSGWLGGWFSRTSMPAEKSTEAGITFTTSSVPDPAKEPQPEPPAQEAEATPATSNEHSSTVTTTQAPAASWLSMIWSNSNAAKEEGSGASTKTAEAAPATPQNSEDTPMEEAPPAHPEPASKPSSGSTWAFWSRETPKSPEERPEVSETGELAVAGDGSERHPKTTNSVDMSQNAEPNTGPSKKKSAKAAPTKDKQGKKPKRNRPRSVDLDTPSRPQTPQSDAASIQVDSPSKAGTKTPIVSTVLLPPNLLLPSFKDTYRMKESPSILQQIAALLLRTNQTQTKQVFLTKDPPKISKAIAIGVHGLFPATYLRPMIGQPTGTSIKFANHCADGIRRWADSHGCGDCEIEKVALEGEGRIEARVSNLWNLLQNWMDHIKQADLVMLACHSQGVPVTVMLLEKLIDAGAVSRAKVGVCAMAGVSLGPFTEYKQGLGLLMGTAAELWEFANSESVVSKRYEIALRRILEQGVRITYVGSIDDQLVPMESAVYSPANHPYIYRAVFVDGRLHQPDFIAYLVGFALKLRNLGVSDHGLVRELSIPLAGNLYGGEGHSRLYEDGQVFDLAISHALETTSVGRVPCEITKYHGLTQPNPYVLPWIMRGLLEEDVVRTELSSETEELLRRFDDWEPKTKPLQNVKYRLEAVRSKL